MTAPSLNWRVLRDHRDPKFMVKGYEQATALYGPASRFAIVEVWAMNADREIVTVYRVRDAETVSDAEVKSGIQPRSVGENLTFPEAVALCDSLAA